MTTREAIGLAILMLIIGACLGIVGDRHTLGWQVLNAQVQRSDAERRYYQVSTDALLAEINVTKVRRAALGLDQNKRKGK